MGMKDANGIYQYDETDNEATFSELLNLGMESVSETLADTGWVPITAAPGFTKSSDAAVRRFGDLVAFRGTVSKSSGSIVQTGAGELAFTIPDARFSPTAYTRIAASGYGGATANIVIAQISANATQVYVLSNGGTQNAMYLGGVMYFAE